MPRVVPVVAAAIAFVISLGGVLAVPAEAHERRQVGKYTFVVGWNAEPTTEGIPNATFLRVFETAANRGIEGLDKAIRLTVRSGGSAATFEPQLRPVPGQAGSYIGDIVPTRPGDYTFTVSGKVEDLDVNEQFESGPGRFDVVRPLSVTSYPDAMIGPGDLARTLAELRDSVATMRILVGASLALSVASLVVLMTRRGRAGVTAVALALAVASSTPVAAAPLATVGLVKSDPAANERLAGAPSGVTLTFSEDIGDKSTARLLRSDGVVVPTGPAKVDHTRLILTPPALTAGTYVVHYTAVDPHDGHETMAYFAFAIGADPPAALGGFDVSAGGGGLTARLAITPGRAGENTYSLAVSGVDRATLRFEPIDLRVGTSDQQLRSSGGGFTGTGMELALSGKTRVTALVRKPGDASDTKLTFDLTVPAPAAVTLTPAPSPTTAPTPARTPLPTPTPLAAASPSPPPVPASGPDPALLTAAAAAAAVIAYLAWRRLGRRGA